MTLRDLCRAWRWLLNVECAEPFCHQRRVCWRWHVVTATCPTCKRELAEGDAGFMDALWAAEWAAEVAQPPCDLCKGTGAVTRAITGAWGGGTISHTCPNGCPGPYLMNGALTR